MALLELFHPDGRARTSLLIGSNCPSILQPDPAASSGKDLDLVILAPTQKELRASNWLGMAARMMTDRLAADGIGYLLAPPTWRFSIVNQLRCQGLVTDLPVWHLPNWTSSQYMLPYRKAPAEFAFSKFIGAPAWKRRIANNWFHLPGANRFFGFIWPSAGIVIRRPGTGPLFEWLFDDPESKDCNGNALIQTSWRGKNGSAVVYRFSNCESQPSVIAKVVQKNRPGANSTSEAAILNHLGPAAEAAGARIPRVVQETRAERPAMLQTHVHGQPASDLLRSQPYRLFPIFEKLVAWLERWHRSTAVVRPFQAGIIQTNLLSSAWISPLLAKIEAQGSAPVKQYRDWLESFYMHAAGIEIPLVAAHNDLTMSNILIGANEELGVIDWETGCDQDLPLTDFFYSLTDAVLLSQGFSDRLEAFKACFAPAGSMAPLAARWQARLAASIGIAPRMAVFCFHACWLRHAAVEQLSGPQSVNGPFFRIVEWLAANYTYLSGVHV